RETGSPGESIGSTGERTEAFVSCAPAPLGVRVAPDVVGWAPLDEAASLVGGVFEFVGVGGGSGFPVSVGSSFEQEPSATARARARVARPEARHHDGSSLDRLITRRISLGDRCDKKAARMRAGVCVHGFAARSTGMVQRAAASRDGIIAPRCSGAGLVELPAERRERPGYNRGAVRRGRAGGRGGVLPLARSSARTRPSASRPWCCSRMSAIELIVVFLGFPGVGKGVQARELCTRGSLERLSTGEILRDEIVRATEVGRRVQALIDRGRFADDETVLGLV